MLVGKSSDAVEDAASFAASGISDFDVFDFAREGKRPDGSPVKVAFSLAFARDPSSPDAAFFVCQQHYPENFWNPDFQRHANGATAIPAVVMVADSPGDHAAFLKAFTGAGDLRSGATGITAHTKNGDFEIMAPAVFRDQFDVVPVDGRGNDIASAALCGRRHRPRGSLPQRGRNHAAETRRAPRRPAGGSLRCNPDIRRGELRLDPGPLLLMVAPDKGMMSLNKPLSANPHCRRVGQVKFGNDLPISIIAGPCQLESRAHALEVASALKEIAARLKIGLVYKTSFDKANRTSGVRGTRHRSGAGAADLCRNPLLARSCRADGRARARAMR